MKRLLAPALLAPMLVAVPAHAQQPPPYYDPNQPQPYDRAMPSYDDDESGYTGGYQARSDDPRPGGAGPVTTYAPPGPGYGGPGYGGAGYGGPGYGAPGYGAPGYGGPGNGSPGYGGPGYGGGPDGQGGGYDGGYNGDDQPPPPPPPSRPRSTRPADSSSYADRIARWRARADACEAGDTNACNGPD